MMTPLDIEEKIDQIFNLACPASPPHYCRPVVLKEDLLKQRLLEPT